MSGGVALLGVDEAGEEDGIPDKEDGRVVAHEVPVTLLGVELHGEAPRVAGCVGRPGLAAHRGEAKEAACLLTNLAEDGGLAVLGDVVGDLQVTMGSCRII